MDDRHLDLLGYQWGIVRMPGEDDGQLRLRMSMMTAYQPALDMRTYSLFLLLSRLGLRKVHNKLPIGAR
jgi:hypothetical protein